MKDQKFIENRIDEMCDLLLTAESREDLRALFEDMCTYKEVEQMALRLYAAKLFSEGKTYTEIIAQTELSSATLSRVSRSVSHGSGGYRKFCGK